jgi:hypothetical protein
MNFKDINPLIGFGDYQIDMPLSSLERTINQYCTDSGLDLDPDFQRGHVWTVQQQQAFVEFVLRGGKTPPLLFNDPQWRVSRSARINTGFVLVDGKQRINAFLKYLRDELPIFRGYLRSQIEDVWKLEGRQYLKIYINDLPTRADVLKWYLELNSGGTPHAQEELLRVRELLNKEFVE